METNTQIGIIGGSGLYAMDDLKDMESVAVQTPFGQPSSDYILGTLAGVRLAFLPRHGIGHGLTPSEINYRANIYGFKKLGAAHIISVTAVGSLKEKVKPLDVVIPDQFYDRTKNRLSTFFGNGLVAHVAFAQPICPYLSKLLYATVNEAGLRVHHRGSLVCIEGPAFSTKAESRLYASWGMDIVGMTSLTEAKLAREAEICYAAMALVTDYDCWREGEAEVTVAEVVANLNKNITHAKQVIRKIVPKVGSQRSCLCANALAGAIMTDVDAIPRETSDCLELLIKKYLPH
jgi:5'-methylthioadenosine phosphorylase